MSWQPISTAPRQKFPMIVVRGILESGYVTDPWCVWWQEGAWQRWPHKQEPTHWLALPPPPAHFYPIQRGNEDLVPFAKCMYCLGTGDMRCVSKMEGRCPRCLGTGEVQG